MNWYGITGGIGTGKSSVSSILKSRGWPIVDADELAREALAPGTAGFQEVISTFGESILDINKNIDRQKLGQIVFKNSSKLRQLENIIHPLVQKRVAELKNFFLNTNVAAAFYDVPLLFEKKLNRDFDSVILVYCTPQQQRERLLKKTSLSVDEISDRINAQISIDEKKNKSDFIIDNTRGKSDLLSEVIRLEEWIKNQKHKQG